MQNSCDSALWSVCKGFLSAFQGVLSWKWDGRFGTALAEFRADEEDRVRAILEHYLSVAWNSSNIGEAPDSVRMINSHLGGLMSGQMLLTSDPDKDAFMFCAWWPWNDAKTVSIRVGPSYKEVSASEKAERIKLFKDCFGF